MAKATTDDDLKALLERKREEGGLATGHASPPAADVEPVTVPCRLCGKPITVPVMRGRFRIAMPRSGLVHEKCRADEQRRRERQQREAEHRRREAALAAVRADLPAALTRCGVEKHWLAASFDLCPDLPLELVVTARRWAAEPMGILYLHSAAAGTGKTWLATAILRRILQLGLYSPAACRYIAERDYLDGLKAAFDKGDGSGEISPRRLPGNHPRRVGLLFYDDLGSERQSGWTRSEIAKLIEGRHAAELPTVITANIPPDGITEAVDGRVASRIAEYRMMLEFPQRDLRAHGKLGADRSPAAAKAEGR